jgi:rhodanese-related sulfurtransferase
MTTLSKLDPKAVAKRLNTGDVMLIDIRDPDEYARERIFGAVSLPVSAIDTANLTLETGQQAIFHCKSGMRTDSHSARLSDLVAGEAYTLAGGLDAWRRSGLPTEKDAKAPLEINRQVQITAGSLILIGVLLGQFIHPGYYALSAFVGAGLMFAGVSGWCGMANLLSVMPWNRKTTVG